MLNDLIDEIDAHLRWRARIGSPVAESTFGRQAVDDGKLLRRLRGGGQITVAKAARIRDWIAADRTSRRSPKEKAA